MNDQKDAEIASLAHRFWEERGRPIGSPELDWFRAVDAIANGVDLTPFNISPFLQYEPDEATRTRSRFTE